MIYEAMTKYDAEIAKCTDYYAKQCALMEVARGQISAANFVAANSRALILDAQGNINMCEMDIPETKQELKNLVRSSWTPRVTSTCAKWTYLRQSRSSKTTTSSASLSSAR